MPIDYFATAEIVVGCTAAVDSDGTVVCSSNSALMASGAGSLLSLVARALMAGSSMLSSSWLAVSAFATMERTEADGAVGDCAAAVSRRSM
jgi:hypothetical protein